MHAVGPNRESSSVAAEPQRGQRTVVAGGVSVNGTGPLRVLRQPGVNPLQYLVDEQGC